MAAQSNTAFTKQAGSGEVSPKGLSPPRSQHELNDSNSLNRLKLSCEASAQVQPEARQQGMHVAVDQMLRLTNPGRLQAFRDKASSTTKAVAAGGVTVAAVKSQQGMLAQFSAMQ
ncbi:hypothetical protein COCOBI_13-1200 [Coccomyxa sp. Obi]|nr:hypothetical protein COCOBI_13-1200 [Coccomyxa sp. Obi]